MRLGTDNDNLEELENLYQQIVETHKRRIFNQEEAYRQERRVLRHNFDYGTQSRLLQDLYI